MTKIPVILDTDIGDDIDDTWALAMLLNCPELDLKLVVGSYGDTTYRARLLAKLLEAFGRPDIPVAVGPARGKTYYTQADWLGAYQLDDYSGLVQHDGVAAIIEAIRQSPEPVTLIGIGPTTTIHEVLDQAPDIIEKTRFVGMHGSLAWSHHHHEGNNPIAEYNVSMDIPACQATFGAAWPITITPLDSCGRVVLSGDDYQAILDSDAPMVLTILDNYRCWAAHHQCRQQAEQRSSVLFDTVAIYLAFASDLLEMRDLRIRIDNDGMMLEDPSGRLMQVAIGWRDLEGFTNLLVQRLTAGSA